MPWFTLTFLLGAAGQPWKLWAKYGQWRENEQKHLSGPQPCDGRKMQTPKSK